MAIPDGFYKFMGGLGVEMRRRERRRRFGIIEAEFRNIDLVTQTLDARVSQGRVTEIGLEGLRLICDGRIEPGDWLEMKLKFSPGSLPLTVIAEARHIHNYAGGPKGKAIGMKILEIGSHDKERLTGMLSANRGDGSGRASR